jgi:hypothetical protein
MCKDNWNSLNFDYKNLVNFDKGTCNHISFWELSFEKKKTIPFATPIQQKNL